MSSNCGSVVNIKYIAPNVLFIFLTPVHFHDVLYHKHYVISFFINQLTFSTPLCTDIS